MKLWALRVIAVIGIALVLYMGCWIIWMVRLTTQGKTNESAKQRCRDDDSVPAAFCAKKKRRTKVRLFS